MRYFFIIIITLSLCLLYLNGTKEKITSELPIFLKYDSIAKAHTTKIEIEVAPNTFPPSKEQITNFQKDYAAIWAHLNNLFATNNTIAGKEYYTEEFFKEICLHHSEPITAKYSRTDNAHKVRIENWSTDGLVCTIHDEAILAYGFPEKKKSRQIENIYMVLLYQGDHWRIDAISIEKVLKLSSKIQNYRIIFQITEY